MTKLLLIDSDSIFRLGFCTAIESFPDLQVVAQADSGAAALQILQERVGTSDAIDLVVLALVTLDLGDGAMGDKKNQKSKVKNLIPILNSHSPLQLCRELKMQYPTLPIFLLSSLVTPAHLAAARAAGVEGYCPKGTDLSELVMAMRCCAAGQFYWKADSPDRPIAPDPLALFRYKLRSSGLRQIDVSLALVTAQLQNPSLSTLDWFVVSGRRRELLAARWLVDRLLFTPSPCFAGSDELKVLSDRLKTSSDTRGGYSFTTPKTLNAFPQIHLQERSTLFNATLKKLQSGLQNQTGSPLEIDILRNDRKLELLYLILQKLEDILAELRESQVQASQMEQKRSIVLQDLWQASATDFFGKYYTLQIGNREFELANVLLQDSEIIRQSLLDKIPFVDKLFTYLLYKAPLHIDNYLYNYDTVEAMERAEVLLQNLLIKMANAVVQPLLNKFADVEALKYKFYDRRLISTRDIARFRNNLSWKYRWEKYIIEPKAIFESRHILFVLSGIGIKKISIYAPRSLELEQLTGTQLAFTILLEARDAIAPRLRSAIAFIGSGVIYLLTQVIGRGIGLIGRGIIQGIGTSLQETRVREK